MRCYYCKKIVWPWNSEETYLPTAPYPIFIRVGFECKPIWEKHERARLKEHRASLVPPDNGYMPQDVKDWIEGKE